MKKFVASIVTVALLSLSLVATAWANEKNLQKTITFTEDVHVNDTVVKKGEYRVRFDAKTNEVSLLKDGDVVLTTKATVETRPEKARYNSAVFKGTEKGRRLEGFTFAGDRRAILLTETSSTTTNE